MQWLYLLLSFVVVAFAQPVYIGWLGVVAAFVGYALFWRGLHRFSTSRRRFFFSLIWFASVQAVQLSWMTSTTYMGPLIYIVYGVLCLGIGAQFGVISLLVTRKSPSFFVFLGIAGIWTIFEWIRIYFISGFTWNPVGMALTGNPYSVSWSAIFGVYGLSFWVILVNLFGYKALFFSRSFKSAACWIFLGVLPFAFGFYREKNYLSKVSNAENLSVLLIQPALLPEQRDPTPNKLQSFVSPWLQWERIIEFIKAHSQKKLDLIVLPESALPFGAFRKVYAYDKFLQIWEQELESGSLQSLPTLTEPLAEIREGSLLVSNSYWAQALSNHFNSQIVIGLDYYDKTLDQSFNAAFQFSPQKKSPEHYEKRLLVPLSEYIPFSWCKPLASRFGIYDSFTPGAQTKIFSGKAPFAVSICIEEIYTSLMRESRKEGALFFVNLTNDVWFPSSLLPDQHFYHGAIRAAEHGIPLIRSTNTGVTGVVDPLGRPFKVLESKDRAGCISIDVPMVSYPTIYTYLGDALILSISALFSLLFFLVSYGSKIFYIFSKPSIRENSI